MSFELERVRGFWCRRAAEGGVGICFAGRGPDLDVAEAVRLLAPPGLEPAWLRQVHSADVVEAVRGSAGEADALVTRRPDLALAIVTADCVPLLIAGGRAGEGRELAAVHAGWRGIAKRIAPAAVERLASRPAEMTAWLGPAIGKCCYEVGEDVAGQVTLGAGAERGILFPGPRGRPHLDLAAAVESQLREAGVERIHRLDRCTRCDPMLRSYRREGPSAGRNLALIYPLRPRHPEEQAGNHRVAT